MQTETFELRVPKPAGPLLAGLEAALARDGAQPLRWAVVAVEDDDVLVVAGVRLAR